MSQNPVLIPKQPEMTAAEDYFRLRKEGIGYIEGMASEQWTDYNTHDPGITTLEALCYAITDLAYRTGWNIEDLLAGSTDQPFFTARDILTINPLTPDDYRRLLIDIESVRNAWIVCKECSCGQKIDDVAPKGLYDVLLELEAHELYGDLNDRKITRTYNIELDGRYQTLTVELRFPEWSLGDQAGYDTFVDGIGDPANITLTKFSRSSVDNNVIGNDELRKNWRNVFFISYAMEVDGNPVEIRNVSVRLFSGNGVKNATTVSDLADLFIDASTNGFVGTYRNKRREVKTSVAAAVSSLHAHRNLDEDYCSVSVIGVEDIAACADVEVAPDADIERVQAEIWFRIERYFNPGVPFHSLQELRDQGIAVEDIFNGPVLDNGFICDEDLAASGLKTVIRVSDIINLLMDIDGVVAISNMQLTKYDAQGNVVKGSADPTWSGGTPIFDPNRISASWLMYVTERHLPRLYHNLSNVHFIKNGLPFDARQDEAYDTLMELRGAAERSKIRNAAKDLPIPEGTTRSMDDISPVQYGFPLVYGIGRHGLPTHASTLRRAQARQLKAYLMVFEQILGNCFAQIAHVADLFALRPDVDRTYFHRLLSESVIAGYDDLVDNLTDADLATMVETVPEFHERRNRFLDHVMARFGEQFGEYALLMTNWKGERIGNQRLIEDKVSFLKAYPAISGKRAKAFDYRKEPALASNYPGIKKRVSLLLGFPNLRFEWTVAGTDPGPFTIGPYQLVDGNDAVWFEGDVNVSAPTAYEAQKAAYDSLLVRMTLPTAYQIQSGGGQYTVVLLRADTSQLGAYPVAFDTLEEARGLVDELIAWASNERAIVVEHLLLRPKFPGDALYPDCGSEDAQVDCGCDTCSGHDPYSFRLTFVMPGWSAPYNENMDLRGFANRTIQYETPSHLLPRICWVGNDGFIENVCDPIVGQLANLLEEQGVTTSGSRPTCTEARDCATVIYLAFTKAFSEWYEGKTLDYIDTDVLTTALTTIFDAIEPEELTCTTDIALIWNQIEALLLPHFHFIALYGWQFERFENAWELWLDANARIDWMEERLHDRTEAILLNGLLQGSPSALCECAASIVEAYGQNFRTWMEANIAAGRDFADFQPFVPQPVALCSGMTFRPGTATTIGNMLAERYASYAEVSYRLWVVLHLLHNLRNVYPGATLHDCDDGSDLNPVRLGSTALGNYISGSTPVTPVVDAPVVETPVVEAMRSASPAKKKKPQSKNRTPKKK